MKIGIFGGTFDPFTPGHYEVVNKVLADKLVDNLIVVPTIVNYYRNDKDVLFDVDLRRKIIQSWFAGRDDVVLDFYEYDFLAWNIKNFGCDRALRNRRYFHMLSDIIARYGDSNEYFTVVGGDSWNSLSSWYKMHELHRMSKFIVIKRDANEELKTHGFSSGYLNQVMTVGELSDKLTDKLTGISATKIRKHLEDACSGMSMGPNCTPYSLYLDEVDDYKKSGKTWLDRQREFDSVKSMLMKGLSCKNDEKLLAHTPIFDLVEAPEVEAGFKPVKVKSPDWVSVIVEKDGKLLMVKQLRYGVSKELEEFPCGMVEKDEDPIDAGMRELEEETGVKLLDKRSIHYLGKFAANPAFMTNFMHYLHVNLDWTIYEVCDVKLDPHEHLTSCWVDKNDAFNGFIKSQGSSLMGCAWMLCMKNHII